MGNNPLKSLVKQTAVYGLSSIIGRLLNYLLVPLYTHLIFETHEYGVVTLMYSYVAFLLVLLTYGMETAFFRFYQNKPESKNQVLGTTLYSLIFTSSLFVIAAISFRMPVSEALGFSGNAYFITLMALTVGLDAITAIPFALLRAENKALKFATLKFINIGVNIGLNLFFFLLCPWLLNHGPESLRVFTDLIYNPEIGVGYVFIANLAATSVTFLLMVPAVLARKSSFSLILIRSMLVYALPLMVAGLAGIANDSMGKIMLSQLLPAADAMSQLGIYGASYKIAILVTLFIQAYRLAADPFFFSNASKPDAPELYGRVMKYFVVVCAFIFLFVTQFIGIIQHFVGAAFRDGLGVVPILLLANILLGVYFNLSVWYKLSGKTHYGIYISLAGVLAAFALNMILIPQIGFYGAAWATAAGYGVMALLAYLTGTKNLPIPYDLLRMGVFAGLAAGIFLLGKLTGNLDPITRHLFSIVMLIAYGLVVCLIDKDIKSTVFQVLHRIRGLSVLGRKK